MSLPVFFPAAEVAATLPAGEGLTVRELCGLAGVACRVTGAPAERRVRLGEASVLRAIRAPGPLSEVWLGVPPAQARARALTAVGLLAYGVLDYCARESLRGLAIAKPSAGRGRPISGRAIVAADRQRRYRERISRRR